MLRLPPFRYHRPETGAEAVALLAEYGADARPIAGGTDLIPNMKHGLFEPAHLIGLNRIHGFTDIQVSDTEISIGAGATLAALSRHPEILRHLPSLADAAGHVAGPQLRARATLGGNVCLDTRCTYYNQTQFWREALGFCLKKDGDTCHVTRVGKKCVAAHSADTPPVLATLDAVIDLTGPDGDRTIPVADFFVADGIWNSRREPNEIVTRVRVPRPAPSHRMAYTKLRQRKSIDFPLVTVAAWADAPEPDRVAGLKIMVTALGSRPKMLTGLDDLVAESIWNEDLIEAISERAFKQCHPLENIIVDTEWRRAMVPVYVKRALRALVPIT